MTRASLQNHHSLRIISSDGLARQPRPLYPQQRALGTPSNEDTRVFVTACLLCVIIMTKGDHVFYRGAFGSRLLTHHGIDRGDGTVIEFGRGEEPNGAEQGGGVSSSGAGLGDMRIATVQVRPFQTTHPLCLYAEV